MGAEPTWKALPTHKLIEKIMRWRRKIKMKVSGLCSSFTSLPFELVAFQFLLVFVYTCIGRVVVSELVVAKVYSLCVDSNNKLITGWNLDWFQDRIGRWLPSCEEFKIPSIPGRLGPSI